MRKIILSPKLQLIYCKKSQKFKFLKLSKIRISPHAAYLSQWRTVFFLWLPLMVQPYSRYWFPREPYEFIITVEDLSCRSSYDKFIKRLKSVDKRYIRQLRIRNLKNKFAIQQWKEIELIIRGWSLTSLNFEATRLDKEHCQTLLYFLKNHRRDIELTSESLSLSFLFRKTIHAYIKIWLSIRHLKTRQIPKPTRISSTRRIRIWF